MNKNEIVVYLRDYVNSPEVELYCRNPNADDGVFNGKPFSIWFFLETANAFEKSALIDDLQFEIEIKFGKINKLHLVIPNGEWCALESLSLVDASIQDAWEFVKNLETIAAHRAERKLSPCGI